MDRRMFVTYLVASAIATHPDSSEADSPTPTISLSFGALGSSPPVPDEFVGLSYESAQLANPDFFSAKNSGLIRAFRKLAPRGNLRLGGGSSEYTTYSDNAPSNLQVEVFGPDTSKTVKEGSITSAFALRNLREFLDAVNWSCLYGLNLGQGAVENAVRESSAAYEILGPRLLAFQIGNEPDSFRRRFRPETYGPSDFLNEWRRFHAAIVEKTPKAKFAGPDISNKLPYLSVFAEEAMKHTDVILLTSHYYAMGPAGTPSATIDNLLDPEPRSSTLKLRDFRVIADAQQQTHLPYRMSEGNSCWNGGQPGVSDTFASALWCADYMLQCAARGWSGVNMHGGGNGYYTPIAGTPSTGFMRRPEYFGIKFAQRYVGAQLVDTSLVGADPRVNAFAFERSGQIELVLVNKTSRVLRCAFPAGVAVASRLRLSAPTIDAKEGVQLSSLHDRHRPIATAPPYTATAFDVRGFKNQDNSEGQQ